MGLLLSVLSAVAAVVSIWLAGTLFGLEVTPRLFMLTFLLVCFSGAHSIEGAPPHGPLLGVRFEGKLHLKVHLISTAGMS